MRYFTAILLALGVLACHATGQVLGTRTTPVVSSEDPLEMLRTYLRARQNVTGKSPVIMVCDPLLGSKITASVREQLVASALTDSVVVDSTCTAVRGEIRDNKFRQYLVVDKIALAPAESVRVEARAVMSFGSYHREYAFFDAKNRSDFRLVFKHFISN